MSLLEVPLDAPLLDEPLELDCVDWEDEVAVASVEEEVAAASVEEEVAAGGVEVVSTGAGVLEVVVSGVKVEEGGTTGASLIRTDDEVGCAEELEMTELVENEVLVEVTNVELFTDDDDHWDVTEEETGV